MRDASAVLEIFRSKATTGIGNWILVEGYRHLTASLDFAASFNGTVKCVGSIGKGGAMSSGTQGDSPDPTNSQSESNSYDFIEMIDLQSGSDIDGDTGIALAGSNDHRLVNINTDGLKWITFYITARSAGNASAKVKLFRD